MDGFLTVYLNPATQALAAGSADFQREVNEAINGAVHDNWEGIREYTKTTDTGATVSMTIGTAVGLTDLLGLGTNDFNTLRFASSTEAGPTPGAVFICAPTPSQRG